jgi:hypothetical protein
MHRLMAVFVTIALASTTPVGLRAERTELSGQLVSANRRPLARVTIQLRDLATGQIVATTTSSETGTFALMQVVPGTYILEVLGSRRTVLSASGPIVVDGVTRIDRIALTTPDAAAATAPATGDIGTVAAVTAAAAAAGVAGLVAGSARPTASRSE